MRLSINYDIHSLFVKIFRRGKNNRITISQLWLQRIWSVNGQISVDKLKWLCSRRVVLYPYHTYTYLLNIFNSIFIMNQEWPIIGTICDSFFSLFIPLEWNRNAKFSNTDNSSFIMKNITKRVKKPSIMWILKFPAWKWQVGRKRLINFQWKECDETTTL